MLRQRLDLDGAWEFFPDPERKLRRTALADTPPRPILVPGPWQAQFADLRDYSGVAWYRRVFDAPSFEFAVLSAELEAESAEFNTQHSTLNTESAEFNTQHSTLNTFILHFGAVDYHATVWLNGQRLGEHEGGYLPFELDASAALRLDGPNELVVRVIDPSDDSNEFPAYPFAEIPHGKQSWYGPISGIWQSVYLEARAATHITRLKVTPDVPGEQALVRAALSQPAERPMLLVLTLHAPDGRTRELLQPIERGTSVAELAVPIEHPMLWDTRSPHLYRLEAALAEEPRTENQAPLAAEPVPVLSSRLLVLDALSTTFGMRSITTSADGHLMLNGRVLYLRGALDQDYYPGMIYTPFSDAELDDQFAKAKHMGLNCLRTHIKITDPRYYDAADRAGLLIWTELPNWENLTAKARVRARDTLGGMVERDWNHPSIIIWTIINEGWGVDLAANADHRAWLAEMYAYVKELDPHRLIVGNSPCLSNFHVVTDIEDFHNYYAIPDHYRKWCDWVQAFASRPAWTFAHSYENIDTWRAFMRDPWNPLPRTLAPEVRRRGNEPMVVSEFGNWGLPNIERLRDCYGGQEPWWFETGLEWGDGVVYPHGIEQRFKAYHLNKVFPTLADLTAASQRMQFTALKYEIEQMRRHPSIVGYIITEFTDVHWECNGLLDLCRNPKAFYDVIGQVNSADALVPDVERVVFWGGERCEVRLALSHFSDADLRGGRLEWHVDLWPTISGAFEQIPVQTAQVINVGTVVFDTPPVEQSARARIEFRLIDAAGNQVTCNHQELYIFPKALAAPPPDPDGAPISIWAGGSPSLAAQLRALGYHVAEDLAGADLAIVEVMTDELRWHVQNGGRVLWLADAAETQQTYLGSLSIAQRKGRSWQGDWASNFNWIRQDRMFSAIPTGGTVDFAFADLIPDQVIVGLSPRDFTADVHAGLFVGWLHHTVALIAERHVGNGRLLISTFHLSEHIEASPVARIMLNDLLAYLVRPAVRGEPAYVEEE